MGEKPYRTPQNVPVKINFKQSCANAQGLILKASPLEIEFSPSVKSKLRSGP